MWNELLAALALVMVLEGIMPFLNPSGLRRTLLSMADMDDSTLRIAGLLSMLVGVLLLHLIRNAS